MGWKWLPLLAKVNSALWILYPLKRSLSYLHAIKFHHFSKISTSEVIPSNKSETIKPQWNISWYNDFCMGNKDCPVDCSFWAIHIWIQYSQYLHRYSWKVEKPLAESSCILCRSRKIMNFIIWKCLNKSNIHVVKTIWIAYSLTW